MQIMSTDVIPEGYRPTDKTRYAKRGDVYVYQRLYEHKVYNKWTIWLNMWLMPTGWEPTPDLVAEEQPQGVHAMNFSRLIPVTPSHTIDKDGSTVITWTVVIPKEYAEGYGCSKDQVRKDVKKKGAIVIFNQINNASYSELPSDKTVEENEDKLYKG
jgi:hypothetical protein